MNIELEEVVVGAMIDKYKTPIGIFIEKSSSTEAGNLYEDEIPHTAVKIYFNSLLSARVLQDQINAVICDMTDTKV